MFVKYTPDGITFPWYKLSCFVNISCFGANFHLGNSNAI
jgi:hypothetical protein